MPFLVTQNESHVGEELTTTRCVMTQKNAVFMSFAAEALTLI